MKIAVKDACLLIDLEAMGILDTWFLLGIETLTSDLIVEEVRGRHPGILSYVRSGALCVESVPLFELIQMHARLEALGLSLADVSVFYLAQRRKAMLLTCDRALRQHAGRQHIECHGSIWVLDQLVSANLLAGSVAADKLEALMAGCGEEQRYLSSALTEPFIRRWRKT